MPRTQEIEDRAFRAGDRVSTYDGPGTVVNGRRRLHGQQYVQVLLDTTARRLGITHKEASAFAAEHHLTVVHGYYAEQVHFFTASAERYYAERLCQDYGLTAWCSELCDWKVIADVVDWTMEQFSEPCFFCDRDAYPAWASSVLEGFICGLPVRLAVCLRHQDMLLKNNWGMTAEEREAERTRLRRQAQ
jgi:hypothetical protein